MKKSEGPDLKKQIFVIGAGASGLMAAIQAAVYGAAVTGDLILNLPRMPWHSFLWKKL